MNFLGASPPDNCFPTYADNPDSLAAAARANPPPNSIDTPQGNLFCTNVQSNNAGATLDSCSEVNGQNDSSDGNMNSRNTINIAAEASSTN